MKNKFLIVLLLLLCGGLFFFFQRRGSDEHPTRSGNQTTSVTSEVRIYQHPIPVKHFGLQEKLAKIMIPHMEFDEVTISDVIHVLRAESKKLDPEKKGVNIVLLLGNPSETEHSKSEDEVGIDFLLDDDEKSEHDDSAATNTKTLKCSEPRISLMFDDISLGDAIKNICIAADLRYRVEEDAIVIAGKNVAFDKLEYRSFPIDWESDSCEGNDKSFVKKYFEKRGVAFTKGTKIVVDESITRLIVVNTADELRKIECIVNELNTIDPQVRITARFIKMPERRYQRLKKENAGKLFFKPNESLWTQLLGSPSTEIIASATVLTQNGEDAMINMVRNVYFPESWSDGSFKLSDVKSKENDKKKVPVPPTASNGYVLTSNSMPQFADPAELGIILEARPTVDPDQCTISISATPRMSQFISWTRCGLKGGIRMPLLKTWSTDSEYTVNDGYTFPAGSALEDVLDKDTGRRVRTRFLLLLTPRLVYPDGIPLRDDSGRKTERVSKLDLDRWETVSNPTERKLAKIKIAKFDCVDMDIKSVIKLLTDEIHKKDRSVSVRLAVDEGRLAEIPLLTLHLEDISLTELLRYIRLVTNLKSTAKNNEIIFAEDLEPMQTCSFHLRLALVNRITGDLLTRSDAKRDIDGLRNFTSTKGVHLPPGAKDSYDAKTGRYSVNSTDATFDTSRQNIRQYSSASALLKAYFVNRGIDFPFGSTISYDRSYQKMIVHNTPENLWHLSCLLAPLCLEQPQVLIESTIVEMETEKVIELLGGKVAVSANLNKKQIEKIINSNAGRILASQSVVAKSGNEATTRLVSEVYFPESWSDPKLSTHKGIIFPIATQPDFGDSTDIGPRLTVTPYVKSDNHTVALDVDLRFTKFLGLSKYGHSFKIDTGNGVKKYSTPITMPKTAEKHIRNQVKLYSGATLLVGKTQLLDYPNVEKGAMNANSSWTTFIKKAKAAKNKPKTVFFFIKATILNNDGGI